MLIRKKTKNKENKKSVKRAKVAVGRRFFLVFSGFQRLLLPSVVIVPFTQQAFFDRLLFVPFCQGFFLVKPTR